jgi:sugar/nucleoside kinase (ribokinase family)
VTDKNYDVLVAGEINPDLILTDPNLEPKFGQIEVLVQDSMLTPGSSSVIFACGAARLDLRIGFIGVIGEDLFGRFMLSALENAGIDTTPVIIDPEEKTGLTVIFNRIDDRAILTHLGAIDALKAEDVSDDLLSQARHLHVASYFLQTHLQPGLPDLFHRTKSLGLTTSLDTNWDPSGQWAGVLELLPMTNVFLPNEKEALALTGADSIEEAARVLATKAEVVAVKMGASGGMAVRGDAVYRAPAPGVEVVDTVGAGDTFDAGLIYGYLQDWPLEKSLKLAIACGSLSTRKPGGTSGQPTLAEALEVAGR